MKFNAVRITGFKSFADPISVPIEPGLTGVVGPNGCGKSNLAEALRWVMGESSSRSMRAAAMDDVIFAGNARRPARNRAEVTVVLDNTDRTAPAMFGAADVLEVTRRIDREAGSSFRVNGREARARDVQILFADASTGARSPAMVRQGQIGELIAGRPTQRRAILEEAAGISGLHARRNEAEMRLKAAEQNLLRIDDVVGEIEGRLEGLRRQARAAERYRNLSAELRTAQAMHLHLRWSAAAAAATAAQAALEGAGASVEAAAMRQAAAARDQAVAAAALPRLRDREAATEAARTRIEREAEAVAGEERRAAERIDDLGRRIDEFAADDARERREAEEAARARVALAAEDEALAAAEAAAVGRAEAVADRLTEAEAVLAAAEAELSRRVQAAAETSARRQAAERLVRDTAVRRDRTQAEHAAAARDLAAAPSLAAAEATLAAAAAALEAGHGAEAVAEAAVRAAEQAVEAARTAAASARPAAAETVTALATLEAEVKALAGLLGDAARRGPAGVVGAVTVDAGYERALGAAFGDDLDASLTPDAARRWERVAFAGDPALPEGTEPLAAHVRAPPELARRLAQIGICDAATAAVLRSALAPGQQLVDRDGAMWRWDGFVQSAAAPAAAVRRLEQANRLEALSAGLPQARDRRAAAAADLAEAEKAVAAAVAAERAARDDRRRRQEAAAARRNEHARAERDVAELRRRRDGLADLVARRAAEAEAARAEADRAAAELAQLPQGAEADAAAQAARAAAGEARAAVAALRADATADRREDELRRQRRAALAGQIAAATRRVETTGERLDTLAARRVAAVAERDRLAEGTGGFVERRRRLAAEAAAAAAASATARAAREEGERVLAAADSAARAGLQGLSEARETRARDEERLVAAEARRREVEEAVLEAFEIPAPALARHVGLDLAAAPEPAAVETRIQRLQAERDRLGAVNLGADAELAECLSRRDRLTADRDDIGRAIARLREGIATLEAEARARLVAAFEAVDRHFRALFAHLFGGGEARLAFVDAENPLEAGLEIFARPPGKKPQTLSLLSGGEQTLTTLALIFAVFLTNPAPICVLDEVDAPLDDANVERFCDLLDEMTRRTETRFLTVTHNPITMARMHRLFGVTMAERGVSQLVAVELDAALPLVAAG